MGLIESMIGHFILSYKRLFKAVVVAKDRHFVCAQLGGHVRRTRLRSGDLGESYLLDSVSLVFTAQVLLLFRIIA